MNVRHLTDGWTIRAEGSRVPAEVQAAGAVAAAVPGSVTTDLVAAGLLADPFLDDNERLQAWIGATDWVYTRELAWEPDGSTHQQLVFEGIDTIATVSLNGDTLGSTANMHRSHRFDVTGRLRPGGNRLEVRIAAPVPAADAESMRLGPRPHANHHPYNAIRKMACGFGWDWGIDTATSGLWRPVHLTSWSGAALADLRVYGDGHDGTPVLRVHVTLTEPAQTGTSLLIDIRGTTREIDVPTGENGAHAQFPVEGAELWWPRGHGEQHLYPVSLRLHVRGEEVDRRDRQVGFRSVRVETEPDEEGVSFQLLVNDRLVLVRGANWIPDDAFPHRVDARRYATRIDQAVRAGMNLLRVWGGGIYEDENFYAECDRRGVLVWQDFLLACAAYAEEEPLRSEIAAEAREAVARLAAHPSLVILNGGNENLWGRQEWRWEGRLDGQTWGAGYYYDLFPQIVAELAPHVAYTPGSPFSPDPAARQNNPAVGTMHIWDAWNQLDYTAYRNYRPRFVAEFGWQGPPADATLRRALSDDPLTPESPGMIVHQKALNGNDKLTDGLVPHFPLPRDFPTWHWAMSLNQAIAVRTAIEWFRSLTPHCNGTIMWQLNDSWPVTSWAAIDVDGREKPLFHALAHAYAERLVTLQPHEDSLILTLVNDTGQPWEGELQIERRGYNGTTHARSTHTVSVGARHTTRLTVDADIATPRARESEVLVARIGESRALHFLADYRESDLAPAELTTSVEATPTGATVSVHARCTVRDITLLVDRVDTDARVDSGLITLLPGETHVFHVATTSPSVWNTHTARKALVTANDLLHSH